MLHSVYLSLGSNLGNRRGLIGTAIAMLNERLGTVVRQSSLIETEPWGFSSPNMFLNGCVLCRTQLTPLEVLHVTQDIEREMGRAVKSAGGAYHDRIIDIDLLLYDDLRISTPELDIPHPRMWERDFVMIPLREIADPDCLSERAMRQDG